jgi:saccharopine dehydrogenase (NAD+, L-lysine-forming)
MQLTIGIRREDKNEWERRVPLTPKQTAELIAAHGLRVLVQPSPRRIFADHEYEEAGAILSEDLSEARIILGVKEIPLDRIQEGATHLIFSHTIKGQSYNMPMLRQFLSKGSQLIDYERIVDDKGRRLVFFGHHAGLSGMVETFHALGQRLIAEGFPAVENPFIEIRQPYQYEDLGAAKAHLAEVGDRIRKNGLPKSLQPLVCGVLGYGNVARGVHEILECLPIEIISPQALLDPVHAIEDPFKIHVVVFKETDTVTPLAASDSFDLQDYYAHPQRYRADFARYLPHLTLLINAIYWDERYPVLVTHEALRDLFNGQRAPKLRVIGDITCDIEGSIAITVKATLPDKPCFVYDLRQDTAEDGYDNPRGPVVMAVGNLPAEFPKEASATFGEALSPFLPDLARADFSRPLADAGLPAPLRKATIVYQGSLTEDYRYLEQALNN